MSELRENVIATLYENDEDIPSAADAVIAIVIEEALKALPPSDTACGQDALLMWRTCYSAIRALK